MHNIDQENINNLTSLWQKYQSRRVEVNDLFTLNANVSWPYRCWFDVAGDTRSLSQDESTGIEGAETSGAQAAGKKAAHNDNANERFDSETALESVLELALERELAKMAASTLVPIWSGDGFSKVRTDFTQILEQLLIRMNWVCRFQQTAMTLDLKDYVEPASKAGPHLELKRVASAEELICWVDISSEAFGYSIDPEVIHGLVDDQDIHVLLVHQHGRAAASALLYKTGNIVGVHQVGVLRSFQGQGIARMLMRQIIALSVQWQAGQIVLQASDAGKPLYDRLGFITRFVIKNYQRM